MALAASFIAGPAAAAPAGQPKAAKLRPIPNLDISAIGARKLYAPEPGDPRALARLTEPDTAGLVAPPRYTVGRNGDALSGKQVKLSVPVGENRMFIVGGKIPSRPRAGVEADSDNRRHKLESGMLVGGGMERQVGPLEVGASYQFSTIDSADLDPSASGRSFGVPMDDDSSSHSVRATARLRF